jgi:hypothetical protein
VGRAGASLNRMRAAPRIFLNAPRARPETWFRLAPSIPLTVAGHLLLRGVIYSAFLTPQRPAPHLLTFLLLT